ncbi:DUF192 domain-containing protein [Phenylobacterium sp.]|uniref:DUF192 domain-containing protein n=1 Tax=Phenylobacterium sp. TaxID=1871053 RepID=UPI002DE27E05|nr:DUF192 domain-containing protein [Phenylobacterium sp.]
MPLSLTFERRSLIGLAAALALGACAAPPAARAEIGRQDPDHCQGQAVLKPLQPLAIQTARGPARFMVEMADTDLKREYGLMCRKALAPDRGMLFDFGAATENVAFWMRNTLIGLDIIYIRPDGTILSIARQAPPLDENPIPAGGVIRAVLELPGGRAAQLGIQPGDRVDHRIFAR